VKNQILTQIMAANLRDEAQSWVLSPNGTFTRDLGPDGAALFNCHQFFMDNPSLSGRGTAGAKDAPRLVEIGEDEKGVAAAQ
jgi:polyphosphate kinase